jgi:DNA-binding transcriptional MerR regulator
MASTTDELLSVGGLAARLNRSPSTLKLWERTGVIPESRRVFGANHRVWDARDLDLIEQRIAEHEASRQARSEPAGTAA